MTFFSILFPFPFFPCETCTHTLANKEKRWQAFYIYLIITCECPNEEGCRTEVSLTFKGPKMRCWVFACDYVVNQTVAANQKEGCKLERGGSQTPCLQSFSHVKPDG